MLGEDVIGYTEVEIFGEGERLATYIFYVHPGDSPRCPRARRVARSTLVDIAECYQPEHDEATAR